MLLENTLLAARDCGLDKIVLAGGVSANSELRRRMEDSCKKAGYALWYPPLSLCGDNAAMVGAQAFYEYAAGHLAGQGLNAAATMPIEHPVF